MKFQTFYYLCLFLSLVSGCAQVKDKPPEPFVCVLAGATVGATAAAGISAGTAAPVGILAGGIAGGFTCADQDQDTIVDQYDECPDTPPGAQVNLKGCAQDTDEDGVVDYVDACPHSAVSFEVDSQGCPIPLNKSALAEQYKVPSQCVRYMTVSKNQLTRAKPILFSSNSSALNAEGMVILMCVADVAKATSAKVLEIAGYTDTTGPAKYNQQLSMRRVANVRNFLLSEGLGDSQLKAFGRGQRHPAGTQENSVTRAHNRRVEIKAIY